MGIWSSMKKVYLNAYVKNNLGDDLFIYEICKRYPDVRFILEGNKRFKKALRLRNLCFISNDTLGYELINEILCKVKKTSISNMLASKCCQKVMIQGSAFQGSITKADQIKDFFEDAYILGVNFGPYRNDCYRLKMQDKFKKTKDICFRDKASYELFSHLPQVRYSPDIILGMKFPGYRSKNYIVISVMDLSYSSRPFEVKKYAAVYKDTLLSICKQILKNTSYNIVLMSFCAEEGDLHTCNKLAECLASERVHIYNHTNIIKSVRLLGESKGIVASRFHSMILAWRLGRPCWAIVYGEKMEHVVRDFSFANCCSLNELEDLQVSSVLAALEEKVDALRMPNRHFDMLDRVLK